MPAEAKLEREDLVAVTRALRSAQPAVESETAAARAAWPYLIDGIAARPPASARAHIEAAVRAARALPLRAVMAEPEASALTGPGSPLAGRYRDFQKLCSASWRMIGHALKEIDGGTAAAASFTRENVALYIEGVYDAQYSLAETGADLQAAYNTLGAAPVFGSLLTQRQIASLARTYSPSLVRLQPHERVKLGS